MEFDLQLIAKLATGPESQAEIVGKFFTELQQLLLQELQPMMDADPTIEPVLKQYAELTKSEEENDEAIENEMRAIDLILGLRFLDPSYAKVINRINSDLYANYINEYYPKLNDEDKKAYLDYLAKVKQQSTLASSIGAMQTLPKFLQEELYKQLAEALLA